MVRRLFTAKYFEFETQKPQKRTKDTKAQREPSRRVAQVRRLGDAA